MSELLLSSLKSALSKICDYLFVALAASILLFIASVVLFTPLVIVHGLGAVTEEMKNEPYNTWLYYVSIAWFGFVCLLAYELESRGAFEIPRTQMGDTDLKGEAGEKQT